MSATATADKKHFKVIEKHLRMYKHYKVSITNMKKELNYIMPNITANYELREGTSGVFTFKSSTESYAIDRIESKRALELHEDIKNFELLVSCIDAAIDLLEDKEKEYVHHRYFNRESVPATAFAIGYSDRTMTSIRGSLQEKLLVSLKNIVKM